MNIDMIPVEVIGLKKDLMATVHTLRDLACVHIDELTNFPELSARPLTLDRELLHTQEELSFLVPRIDGLISTLGCGPATELVVYSETCLIEARAGIAELMPKVQALTTQREKLQAELVNLPLYEATLRKLLPIIPPSAHDSGNISVGVLVSRFHIDVLDLVTREVLEITNGRAEVVASDVDTSTRAMLIVFPEQFVDKIEGLLGRADVSRLRLPAELGAGPPDVVLATLQQRMTAIPLEIKTIDNELAALTVVWCKKLSSWSACLHEEIEIAHVLAKFGETDLTFVLGGWVPARDIDRMVKTLIESVGDSVLVRRLPLTREMKDLAPVVLDNPKTAKPFESLVGLLALPRYGHIDPTQLMAFFMPIFFGMMLGDVGYGLLLLGISLVFLRKRKKGVIHDVLLVMVMGSIWSIVFGFLYGEAFGTLGEQFGLKPIWFERASKEHVMELLIMSLVIGSVHITLGLVLGVWEALRTRSRSHLLERGGMLVGLLCLFLLVAVLVETLPKEFMSVSIAGIIVGIVLLGASMKWLGILMGPIEFIGLIGNVLSYLRIAAIGLASVYLAKVANDVAGMAGNIIVGIIIAVLIHSLNLVLGAFSPTIHSLRLHYVEFFRKFYESGGKPYQPFKSQNNTT